MQFFLDTADIHAIRKYAEWGIVDGVTTNPSLIAKEGVDLKTRIIEITNIINGSISAEVISTDAEGMIKEARDIATWHPNIYVKLPMIPEGLKALNVISKEGIKTNVTLIFTVSQAVLAAKAGATFVSPFLGRLDDLSNDGIYLIEEIVHIFQNYNFKTKVLAASLRHPKHVVDCMKSGADISTMPPIVLDKLIKHPLTDKGLEDFLTDWEDVKDLQNK